MITINTLFYSKRKRFNLCIYKFKIYYKSSNILCLGILNILSQTNIVKRGRSGRLKKFEYFWFRCNINQVLPVLIS